MPGQDLYTLTWSQRNAQRLISYESDSTGKRIVVSTSAINPDEPVREPSNTSVPDSWPYADQELITSFTEGSESVSIYAIRTYPYARYTTAAVGPEPGVVCDLQVFSLQTTLDVVSFQVSTSNGPWRSAIDIDEPQAYSQNESLYGGLAVGPHMLYVRDAGGCFYSTSFTITDDDSGTDEEGLPTGAVLLRISDKSVKGDGTFADYFQHIGYYYLPSTRATFSRRLPDSAEQQYYSRPTTEIIDRWCVDPGQPPYREMQVSHDGLGGITLTPVDGVTACQILCTVTLSETHQVSEGYGIINAVALAADAGGGHFSLDNFTTEGVEAIQAGDTWVATFADLPLARYTLSYREKRAGGCRASISVHLQAAYGARFAHKSKTADGFLSEILILEQGYSGPTERVSAGPSPIVIDRPGSAVGHVYSQLIQGQEASITLLQTTQEQYKTLFTGDERLFRVDHLLNGVLDFRSFVLPEQYDVAFLNGKQFFSLQATDGLGTLSTVPFAFPTGAPLVGDMLLLDVVLLCLNKLALELPLHVLCSLYPTGADRTASFLEAVKVDVGQYASEKGDPWSCAEVLQAICEGPFQLRLYQERGAWWLERLSDLSTEPLTYFAYSPDGRPRPLVTRSLLRTVHCDSPLHWQTAAQRQQARGAVSLVEAQEGVGELVNQLQRFLPGDDAAALTSWRGDAPYQLVYAGKGKTPILRITGAAPAADFSLVKWLQTPLTSPIPALADASTNIGAYVLTFKVRAYGNQIVNAAIGTKGEWAESSSYQQGDRVIRGLNYYVALQDNQGKDPAASGNDYWSAVGSVGTSVDAQAAQLFVALQVGSKWVRASQGTYDTPEEGATIAVVFADDKEVEVSIRGFTAPDAGSYPLSLRIYQPLAGAAPSPVLVDITDLSITFENNSLQLAESYPRRYFAKGAPRASRTDTDTELFHMDTPYCRRRGTLLDARGLPTKTWQETSGGQQKEIGVFFVRDRASWQQRPAQVLTGVLRGRIGNGALLTDPAEARPVVYLFSSWRRDVKANTHTISAVELASVPLSSDLDVSGVMLTENQEPVLTQETTYVFTEDYEQGLATGTNAAGYEGKPLRDFTRPLEILGSDRIDGYRPTLANLALQNSTWSFEQVKTYVLAGFTGADPYDDTDIRNLLANKTNNATTAALSTRVTELEQDVNQLEQDVTRIDNEVDTIQALIPASASPTNRLATLGDIPTQPTGPGGAILYGGTGQATDGAMTQKAVTDELGTLDYRLASLETRTTGLETALSAFHQRLQALEARPQLTRDLLLSYLEAGTGITITPTDHNTILISSTGATAPPPSTADMYTDAYRDSY